MGLIEDYSKFIFLAIGVFWTLLFLQSGFDKVIDWKGNISWLKGHFEKSFLGAFVKPLVGILAITELVAGLLCAGGTIQVLLAGKTYWLIQGLFVSVISLLMLFFGQRLAKDYEGAKTIAIYFGVSLISLSLLLNA